MTRPSQRERARFFGALMKSDPLHEISNNIQWEFEEAIHLGSSRKTSRHLFQTLGHDSVSPDPPPPFKNRVL